MNLRFVEAFHWAVALKSVTRAAEKLFITQSALSSRIAALESELGVLLLDRRDKQFRLTTAGARFHRQAERLLNLQREIKAEFGSAGAGVGGVGSAESRGALRSARPVLLRLGVIESVLHSWLVGWIQALRREEPTLELALTVETTPVLLDQMRRGTADLVIAALPAAGDGVRTKALTPMAMAFAGRADSAAARARRRLALPALAGAHELLTFQRGSQPHVALLDLCRRHGVEGPRVHTISSISAMVQLVESGFGIATLPTAALERLAAAQRPAVRVLGCTAELAPLPIHMSWRDDPASPVAARVIESAQAFEARPRARRPRRAPSKNSMTP